MTTRAVLHAIYGQVPSALAEIPAEAAQYSPLIPNSGRLEEIPSQTLGSFHMLAPPGTLERRYALALALRALAPDGILVALAPKDKGGNRIANELRQFGCDVTEIARQHYKICRTLCPAQLVGIEEAVAMGGPQQSGPQGLWSQPGVFSWNRLDPGSALLLAHLPALAGRGADLGCGIGLLSQAVLASAAVSQLTLIDIDHRAIAMAERNLTDLRAAYLWADACDPFLESQLTGLDFVVMNPPFHESGQENQSLGQQFIAQAARLLRPGGNCWLTANRHLPYEKLLAQHFTHFTLAAEDNNYKIYAAIR